MRMMLTTCFVLAASFVIFAPTAEAQIARKAVAEKKADEKKDAEKKDGESKEGESKEAAKPEYYSMPWTVEECKKSIKAGMKLEMTAKVNFGGQDMGASPSTTEYSKVDDTQITIVQTNNSPMGVQKNEKKQTWEEFVKPTGDNGFDKSKCTREDEKIKIGDTEYDCVKLTRTENQNGMENGMTFWVVKDQPGVIAKISIKNPMMSVVVTLDKVVMPGDKAKEGDAKEGEAKEGEAKKAGETTGEKKAPAKDAEGK